MFGLTNVKYCPESWVTEDKLCETKYLTETMKHLHNIFPEFNNYEFSILSTQDRNATPAIIQTDKNNILIWISDEFGHYPDNLSPNFDFIFKSYIKHETWGG